MSRKPNRSRRAEGHRSKRSLPDVAWPAARRQPRRHVRRGRFRQLRQRPGFTSSASAQRAPASGASPKASPAPPAPKAPQTLGFPGEDKGLVVLGDRPLVTETPESLLDDDTTPTAKFFIRNNGHIPDESTQGDSSDVDADPLDHHRAGERRPPRRSAFAPKR